MSVYPDSDKVSGPEGILLRSSAVGYWHGEGTAGRSEPVEVVREPEMSPSQPAVNALALRETVELGPLLGANRLDERWRTSIPGRDLTLPLRVRARGMAAGPGRHAHLAPPPR